MTDQAREANSLTFAVYACAERTSELLDTELDPDLYDQAQRALELLYDALDSLNHVAINLEDK